jgi:sugar-specific transcriptional regulator TrmB
MKATFKSASADAINGLTALGFTKYEALAYLMLLDQHPATAYEISKRGGLTKGNVYTALVSLAQKGAVQPVSNDPVRYAPVDPQTLFNGIAKGTAALCKDLASSLTPREREKAIDYVWTLTGEERLDKKINEIISGARQQIWIKGPHHLLEPYVGALKEAARKGAAILVILFGSDEDAARLGLGSNAKLYLHEGSGDMLAVGRKQFVIAADFAETLIADFGEAPHGAYTRSEAVVIIAETMIRHEVYLAEIINAFGPAIEQRFGKDLITLREKYLPPNLFEEVRKRAGNGRARKRA